MIPVKYFACPVGLSLCLSVGLSICYASLKPKDFVIPLHPQNKGTCFTGGMLRRQKRENFRENGDFANKKISIWTKLSVFAKIFSFSWEISPGHETGCEPVLLFVIQSEVIFLFFQHDESIAQAEEILQALKKELESAKP